MRTTVKDTLHTGKRGARACALLLCAAIFFFSGTGISGAASFVLDRRAIEAADWLASTQEKMSRARMFYRILEGLWGSKSVVSHYASRASTSGIRNAVPAMVGKDVMNIFMRDWPELAPTSWKWVEATRDGIVVFEAGATGFHNDSEIERVFHPWWIVDVRVSLPDGYADNPFINKAVARLSAESPSLRRDGGGVVFTVFPGADMMRRLIEATYVMRLRDDWEERKGGGE